MNRDDFMSKAYQALQSFETRWNRGQRGDEPDPWPDDLPEADWWDNLIMHMEQEMEDES